jgi:hypothetical protein
MGLVNMVSGLHNTLPTLGGFMGRPILEEKKKRVICYFMGVQCE